VLQPILLQNGHKKILSKVLRVLNRITSRPNKQENWPPISPAKLSQRIPSFVLFIRQVGSRKNQAPSGGYKLMPSARTLAAVRSVHE
jgi:hypothetical protein